MIFILMYVYSKGMDGYMQMRIDPVERPRGIRNSLELELQAIMRHLTWVNQTLQEWCMLLPLGITSILKIYIHYHGM